MERKRESGATSGAHHVEIYLINLARRPDRLVEMAKQLTRLGLEYIRVEAIDGLVLQEQKHSAIDRGNDGCWQSHQLVFTLACRSQSSSHNVLVLEDDALLDGHADWPMLLDQ